MVEWVALVLTLSTTSMTVVALKEQISIISMLPSVISLLEAPTRRSRSCRQREGWRLNGSVSSETSTRSSNISEVGLPQLCSTSCLPIQKSGSQANQKKYIKKMLLANRWFKMDACLSGRVLFLLFFFFWSFISVYCLYCVYVQCLKIVSNMC